MKYRHKYDESHPPRRHFGKFNQNPIFSLESRPDIVSSLEGGTSQVERIHQLGGDAPDPGAAPGRACRRGGREWRARRRRCPSPAAREWGPARSTSPAGSRTRCLECTA